MAYDHIKTEKKWQTRWESQGIFHCQRDPAKPKFYALNMFPYPSGSGLHVGHLASYTPTEIVARYKRARGFNVLHPMGYDAFGLPAERYAIKTGKHPAKITEKAISNFRRQLKSFGYSFDWSREISTCDPSYYRWTQWLFKIFYKRNLAHQAHFAVNWCPVLRTALANEEVKDGLSEIGGHKVIRALRKQWMLKITQYADRLLEDLKDLDWPESAKASQKNWIGKSKGALIDFPLKDFDLFIQVWTTRPDTLFGASYLVLAPEHPLIEKITSQEQSFLVAKYQKKILLKSEAQRKAGQGKTGVFTGAFAKHPVTNEDMPVWIADYVLMDYGTGGIMAVPAHDEKDYEFARVFNLPIRPVIESERIPFEGDGKHIHSEGGGLNINGLNRDEACQKTLAWLEQTRKGRRKVQYKLRDWLFSRQRYWGEPFPLVRDKEGKIVEVPDEELPVLLPAVADYEPSEKGEPPLARDKVFVNYKDGGRRETDTMPGSAASSWYFLRYTDPHNSQAPFGFEEQKYWMPVDLYVGGSEHCVGHLLYARFWQKVLFDEGLVSHKEPFRKLAHQGVVLGEDGFRMSKSRGNGVNPEELRQKYGADCLRLYICFLGPFDKDKPWSSKGISGIRRFLDRYFHFAQQSRGQRASLSSALKLLLNQTVKKVTEDIESMSFNTAISALMILLNEIYKQNVRDESLARTFSQLIMPFAPHLAEEMWEGLRGEGFVSLASWPEYDPLLTEPAGIQIGVQINGRVRASLELSANEPQESALEKALRLKNIKKFVENKKIKKLIYRPGKILNLIV